MSEEDRFKLDMEMIESSMAYNQQLIDSIPSIISQEQVETRVIRVVLALSITSLVVQAIIVFLLIMR